MQIVGLAERVPAAVVNKLMAVCGWWECKHNSKPQDD